MNVARDAFDTFYLGTHDKCGQFLDQISGSKGSSDVKVQHNIFINDYYKSGCADPQVLLTQLTQAVDKVREKDKKDNGRRKREEDDEESYREDDDLSVLRYNQALLCVQLRQYAQASLILEDLFVNIEPIDDYIAIKICFLLLELCLLQREPEQAVAVLAYLEKPNAFLTVLRSERPKGVEPLVAGTEVDGLDDTVPKGDEDGGPDEDAEGALGDAELQAASGSGEKRSTVSAVTEEAIEGPLPSLTFGSFMPRHGRPPSQISKAEYKFFCLMYRARLSVALKNTKSAKKDVKNALEVLDQELRHAPLLTPHPHTTGPEGSKGPKGRPCEVALREALQHQHSAMVLTLKAYLEYTRQNVRKSIKLLTLCQFNFAEGRSDGAAARAAATAGGEDGDDDAIPTDFHPAQDGATAAVFYNNVGCIHFLMQKPSLATLYFQKALQASDTPAAGSGKVNGKKHDNYLGGKAGLTLPGVCASKHWLDRKAEVSYNAGLQMLMSERPTAAFKCFEQCIPVFRTWPRLWLRIAESCVEMHRMSLDPRGEAGEACTAEDKVPAASWSREAASPEHLGTGSRALVWGVQGSGTNRRWLLTTTRDAQVGKKCGGDDDETGVKGSAPSAPPSAPPPAPRGNNKDPALMSSEAALSHAGMCLRNVLVLVAPMLPDRSSASASAGSAKDTSTEGLASKAAPAASATPTGAAASVAGDKAAAGAVVAGAKASKGAAAGAAAASSGVKAPGGSSSSGSSSRHQARDLLQSEAALLEDAALVKLSYVCLCQHDHASALRYSRRVLEKSYLLMPAGETTKDGKQGDEVKVSWTFQAQNFPAVGCASPAKHPSSVGCLTLAVMYLVEALLLAGKATEAQTLLSGFVSGNMTSRGLEQQNGVLSESGTVVSASKRPTGAVSSDATTACGGLSPATSMGGLTPPWHCVAAAGSVQKDSESKGGDGEKEKAKDGGHATLVMYAATEMPRLGDTQCMLYTNLAALHAQDGNLAEAERCCEQALRLQPSALAPMRSLVYILIRRNKHTQALERLRQTRM